MSFGISKAIELYERGETRCGVVLEFKSGVSKKEIERILAEIKDRLQYMPTIHEFNPNYGGPVWYIP